MNAVGISDIGLQRKRNEDAFLIDHTRSLFIVCDGMGGHRGGDVASHMAVDIVDRQLAFEHFSEVPDALQKAILLANQEIWQAGKKNEEVREMGTTITAAVIAEEKLFVAHVGDSSLFMIRGQKIKKLTRDHTLAEQMLRDGLLKKEEMRVNAFNHVLTRALGSELDVHIDLLEDTVQQDDWILLCTDGLSNLVEPREMKNIIGKQHDPQKAAQALIDLALSRGGHDNITVVLLHI